MDVGGRWTPDGEALALLDSSGTPFDGAEYRRAWTDSVAGWQDVSFGARAPDGTQAALALLRRRRGAESLPLGYGGIVASRALDRDETSSFLRAARRAAKADDVRALAVPINPAPESLHLGGRVIGWTSVVYLEASRPADARLTKKGRQAVARAERAGGIARTGSADLKPFLSLYENASKDWSSSYPADVLRHLAEGGRLRLFDAELDGAVQASAAALIGDRHWMYWLAAQSEAARAAELGYLTLSALIGDAHSSGAQAVNLGASAGLPGVALFKRRFGAIDVPVLEYRSLRYVPAAARAVITRAARR
jgi:GNAT acetyltransferase-like protein